VDKDRQDTNCPAKSSRSGYENFASNLQKIEKVGEIPFGIHFRRLDDQWNWYFRILNRDIPKPRSSDNRQQTIDNRHIHTYIRGHAVIQILIRNTRNKSIHT
jgi:hypothetical protein